MKIIEFYEWLKRSNLGVELGMSVEVDFDKEVG